MIKNLVDSDRFNSIATVHSKASISVFSATLVYLLFTSNALPGLIGGIVFWLIGMFAVSLCIALPSVIVKLLTVKLLLNRASIAKAVTALVDIAYLLITCLATLYIFEQIFS